MDFTNRIVVVTGGAHGIGRAACEAFARCGATVVVVDVEADGAEATAAYVREKGGHAIAVTADVSRSVDVSRYVQTTLEAYGRIDCFFSNAGIGGRVAYTADYDEAEFDAVMGVNVKGVFLGLRHVLPVMIAQGHGAIVNTASVGTVLATPGMPIYVASKHAVVGLTKSAAGEVAAHGVRVNAVCPGPVDTRAMRRLEEQFSPHDTDLAGKRSRAGMPTGRYSSPEDVANVALFLCSDLTTNVTGATYAVDGGRSAIGAAVASTRTDLPSVGG